jgi:hypothetical protein
LGRCSKLGCSSLGVQVWVFTFGCSSRGVQVGCCEFLVSIFRWSKPPHHVKVNPLGEVQSTEYKTFVGPLYWSLIINKILDSQNLRINSYLKFENIGEGYPPATGR